MRNYIHIQQHWELRRKCMSIPEFCWSSDYDEMERMWARMIRELRRTTKLNRLKKKLKIP